MAQRKPAAGAPAKKRIVVVDDHPIMRQGIAQLIQHEPDLEICGEAEDASQGLATIREMRPDLAIIDISLTGRNGIELIKDVCHELPELKMLVMSMHDEALYAERALRAGARGYIMKQSGGKVLMEAIRQILSGQVYVSPNLASKILASFAGARKAGGTSPLEQLTDREFEVFQLIGNGHSTRQIATQLHLSVKTVEVHRLHIKDKLNLPDSTGLVRQAVRWVESQRLD